MENNFTTNSHNDSLQKDNSKNKPLSFLIEIHIPPDQKLDMQTAEDLLSDTGIKVYPLDPRRGPIAVNPKLGHWVVSGTGDQEAQTKAGLIPGVIIRSNPRIEPFNP
jgi:hypothetical protein